jgi:glycosyltransferase involved in cell wall biosynthesis
MQKQKPVVVISGVNLNEGGPLSIMKDAVRAFANHFASEYQLVLLVHNKHLLYDVDIRDAEVKEIAYPKKNWLLRVWFEYVHCYFISKKIKPYLWFALHDMTPNVRCENRIVYCHNPAPFYKLSLREAWIEKSLIFFNFFYGLFYRINIRKNKYVVVQQQWIQKEFEKRYKISNVIVSHPDMQMQNDTEYIQSDKQNKFYFFYPSLPRVFKNFEVLLNATEILLKVRNDFEVMFTFDGTENKYASTLIRRFGNLPVVRFIGVKRREELLQLYRNASCLVFASKMETWGLPITEMKPFNKPMLLANYKYAQETAGDYDKVCFFEGDDALQLSKLMSNAIDNILAFNAQLTAQPTQPCAKNWKELYQLILHKRQLKNNLCTR